MFFNSSKELYYKCSVLFKYSIIVNNILFEKGTILIIRETMCEVLEAVEESPRKT